MKKFLILLATCTMGISCAPLYRQIATLHSNEVELLDNGKYTSQLDNIYINYDFWSENGIVSFEIYNNSANDVLIDMTKSFFIRNGIANDYFNNSSRIISFNLNTSTTNAMTSVRTIVGANKGESIEYKEKDMICIPAKSSKILAKFTLLDLPYRECGFIRNPKRKEKSIYVFNDKNSPLSFENRIMFIIDGNETLLTNKFHANQFQNILNRKCYEKIGQEGCNQDGQTIYTNIYESPNRFYIKYRPNYSNTDKVYSKPNYNSNIDNKKM